jgi:phosphate transport system substrate-binding protein
MSPRQIVLLLILSLGLPFRGSVCAEDPLPADKLSATELQAEIERLEAEISRLSTSPDAPYSWKESAKIYAQLQEAKWKRREEEEPLRIRAFELSQSKAAAEWGQSIAKLAERLSELEDAQRRLNRNAGLRLFRSRHAELAKQAAPATPQLSRLGFDVLSYPRIDGSTSAQPLAVLITCRYFNAPYEWIGEGQRWEKSRDPDEGSDFDFLFSYGRPDPEADLLEFSLRARATSPEQERLAIIINRLLATNASTHQAYLNLISGRSDFGLLARPPSADELAEAKEKGVELETTPCALDGFVFIVNSANPVTSLTQAEIRDIYAGKSRTWPQGGPITAYQREENSGSQQLMRKLVMKELPLTTPSPRSAPQLIGSLMSSHFLELTHDEGGIGYSLYYYERFMSGSPCTKTIAVDGIEPTADTIRQRKYPYTSEVLIVTRKELPPDAPAAKLRRWLLSPEGKSVIRESGYVPVN